MDERTGSTKRLLSGDVSRRSPLMAQYQRCTRQRPSWSADPSRALTTRHRGQLDHKVCASPARQLQVAELRSCERGPIRGFGRSLVRGSQGMAARPMVAPWRDKVRDCPRSSRFRELHYRSTSNDMERTMAPDTKRRSAGRHRRSGQWMLDESPCGWRPHAAADAQRAG